MQEVVTKELPSGSKASKKPARDTQWEKHYLGGGPFGSDVRASADGVSADMVVQGYTLYREGAFCSLKPGEAITLQRSTPEAPAAGKKASTKEDTIVRCVLTPSTTRSILIIDEQVQELERDGRWSDRGRRCVLDCEAAGSLHHFLRWYLHPLRQGIQVGYVVVRPVGRVADAVLQATPSFSLSPLRSSVKRSSPPLSPASSPSLKERQVYQSCTTTSRNRRTRRCCESARLH